MNGGSGKQVISQYPHKKINQKIALLLCNPNFLKDIEKTRKSRKNLIDRIKKLEDASNDCNKKIYDLMIEKGMKPPFNIAEQSSPEIRANFKLLIQYAEKQSDLESDPYLKEDVKKILQQYDLSPETAWEFSVMNFILHGKFSDPLLAHFDFRLLPFNKKEKFQEEMKSLSNLMISRDMMGNNFCVFLEKDNQTNEPVVLIRLFNNTSKKDIVSGWKYIASIRDSALKKGKRFYPLKNLDLANRINRLDKDGNLKSDWEKQEEIFGEVASANFGEVESQRRKKIKQTRSRYKKRFGTKS
jgi:hypothetical protein